MLKPSADPNLNFGRDRDVKSGALADGFRSERGSELIRMRRDMLPHRE